MGFYIVRWRNRIMEEEIKKLEKDYSKKEMVQICQNLGLQLPENLKDVTKKVMATWIAEELDDINTYLEAARNAKKDLGDMAKRSEEIREEQRLAKEAKAKERADIKAARKKMVRDFSGSKRPAPSTNKINHSKAVNRGQDNPRLKPHPTRGTYKGICVNTGERIYSKDK